MRRLVSALDRLGRVTAMAASLALAGVTASAQQGVRGVVVRAGTDDAIERASIQVFALNGSIEGVALSDSLGTFTITVPAPGTYTLHAHRIGYLSRQSDTIHVQADSTVPVRLDLAPSAVMLEAITVLGEAPRQFTPELEGFLARRRMRVGYSFSREDVERLKAEHPVDLLREVPGFVTLGGRASERSYALNSYRCPPAIFVDRHLSRVPQAELLENLSLFNVYGVEVFRDRSSVPSEYVSQHRPRDPSPRCGVILIWTRAAEW